MSLLFNHCPGLSSLSLQEAIIFWFHGCSHHPQWFWSPRRGNLSVFHLSPFYLPCNNGARCHDLSLIFSLKLALSLSSFTFNSVQFSRSVVSDSLQLHESQHARPPCPSPTSGVHWDSHPSSQWYHPAISSSVVPFSSCPQSLPASESFPMSQLFPWGGQSPSPYKRVISSLFSEHLLVYSFSK